VITGTNGKTTTCRLVGEMLRLGGINYLHNASGSNLIRGIATTLINQSSLSGKLTAATAVWEVDEAALPAVLSAVNPEIVLITNLSRDQLDRYGEIDTLINQWQKGLDKLSAGRLIINTADRRLRRLHHPRLSRFGKKIPGLGLKYPPQFRGKINYDSYWAAEAIARALRLDDNLPLLAARSLPPVFGRGERLLLQHRICQINLVKNPASFKAVWQMILDRKHLNQPLLILLNDHFADGTDISWIYDVDFNRLARRRRPVIAGGTRAAELGLRLKHAGLNPKLIVVEPALNRAVIRLSKLPGKIAYILPTYTAMLALRRYLGKKAWN